eukprot:TRINITY_DN2153_c0_g3_i2.p1 TRINITY_DN2153_c0_g3~~TRINITY_DN2153_c0_g3_i2.p1  ORF type:complete len:942 (+),score=226.61 TRINITY_DN2153_c0_g3_i2:4526-7351(+)
MDIKTHQRVEAWLREVEKQLIADPNDVKKRALTFKETELRRRNPKLQESPLLDVEEAKDVEITVPPLSTQTMLAYAAPAFSLTSITMLIGIHGSVFYIGIGAHLAFYAFFIAVARSFDVVTDPIMGWASDVTDINPHLREISKYSFVRALSAAPEGRRRPYMSVFAFGYAVFLVLLFSPPKSLETDWKISLWFGIFYCCFYATDTAANVPYNALGPELSDETKERDKMFYMVGAFKNIGIMLAATLPVLLSLLFSNETWDNVTDGVTPTVAPEMCPRDHPLPFQYERCWGSANLCSCLAERADDLSSDLNGKRKAMTTVAILFAAEYLIAMIWCVYKVRERKIVTHQTAPVVPFVLSTLRNKPFMHLLPAWILDSTAITMIGTMLPFFVEYVVKPWAVPECDHVCCPLHSDSVLYTGCRGDTMCKTDTWLGIGLVALFTAAILSMPVWMCSVKKFGKRKTWLAFNLVTAVTNGIFVFVGAGDPIFMCVLAAVNGIPVGAQWLTESIVADVIDYDELLTGRRNEGKFMIFQTFIPKVVSIPAQTIPIGLLSVFGFITPCEDGPYHPQPDSVRLYMEAIFYGLPTFCALLSFYIKSKFPLTDEMMPAVREGCALHMQGRPARDPITGKIHKLPSFAKDEHLMNAVWKLDNFFIGQLEMLLQDANHNTPHGSTGGRVKLVTQLNSLVRWCMLGSVVSGGIVIGSLATGLIHSQTTSWIPTFCVILFGMCAAATAFNRARLLTAKELLDRPLVWSQCRVVLNEVIDYRNGVDARRAYQDGWFTMLQETPARHMESFITPSPVGTGVMEGTRGFELSLNQSGTMENPILFSSTPPLQHYIDQEMIPPPYNALEQSTALVPGRGKRRFGSLFVGTPPDSRVYTPKRSFRPSPTPRRTHSSNDVVPGPLSLSYPPTPLGLGLGEKSHSSSRFSRNPSPRLRSTVDPQL